MSAVVDSAVDSAMVLHRAGRPPAVIARELSHHGAEIIAEALRAGCALDERGVARALRDAGWRSGSIACALHRRFGRDASEVARVLSASDGLGLGDVNVVDALLGAFNYAQTATALRDGLGRSTDSVLRAVQVAWRWLGVEATARTLNASDGLGLDPSGVARALHRFWRCGPEEVASVLGARRGLHLPPDAVAGALSRGLELDPSRVVRALWVALECDTPRTAKDVHAGLGLDVDAVVVALGKACGVEAKAIVGALSEGLGVDVEAAHVSRLLRDAGVGATEEDDTAQHPHP